MESILQDTIFREPYPTLFSQFNSPENKTALNELPIPRVF